MIRAFSQVSLSFFVMKFNYSSKNKRKFRYLCLKNHIIAVVDKRRMEALASDKSKKGVCKFIRPGRAYHSGHLWA